MRGRARKWTKKARIISAVAVTAAAVVIVSAVLGLRGRDSLKVKEAVSVSINGQLFDWPEGLRLMHKDGVTHLREGKGWTELESYPLMLSGGGLLLQKSMIWTQTAVDKVLRVDYYSSVESGESGVSLVSRSGASAEGADGFLYDGDDTYIFLEKAELTWNGTEQLSIQPLTVVQVGYRDYIHIYGPEAEAYFSYLTEEEVTARFDSGKRIDLATDRYFMPNGAWRLLFMPMERLNTIK